MREAIMEALKKQNPNAKEFYLGPLVDLYLKNPEEVKRLAKEAAKQDRKKKQEDISQQYIYEGINVLEPEAVSKAEPKIISHPNIEVIDVVSK